MKMDTNEIIGENINLLEATIAQLKDKNLDQPMYIVTIYENVCKDIRMLHISAERKSSTGNGGQGFPATPKQIAFLDNNKIHYEAGITKDAASEKISAYIRGGK